MRRLYIGVEAVRQAVQVVAGNRLRAALGGLAVAVAVATVVLVIAGLDGFARYARQASARTFGADTFVLTRVAAQDVSRRELEDKLARNRAIRRSDARFLEQSSARQVDYAPTAQRAAEVSAGGRVFENAALNGAGSGLARIRDLEIARGRYFTRDEEDRAALVAVIGAEVADAVFPGVDPIGRTVRIARRGFLVVGLQARQGSAGGVSLDRFVWIPITAFERVFGAAESLQVFARATDGRAPAVAEDRTRLTMRARRQLRPGMADSFDLLTPEAARSFVLNLSERVGASAFPISVMALLAAIVVVTNTSLVSVTQRTREIGVRRALGATRVQVMLEVVAESLLIAVAGGALGLTAAVVTLASAATATGFELPVNAGTVAWGFGAAAASGVVAGWYPARRAARIDIIAAIRQE